MKTFLESSSSEQMEFTLKLKKWVVKWLIYVVRYDYPACSQWLLTKNRVMKTYKFRVILSFPHSEIWQICVFSRSFYFFKPWSRSCPDTKIAEDFANTIFYMHTKFQQNRFTDRAGGPHDWFFIIFIFLSKSHQRIACVAISIIWGP